MLTEAAIRAVDYIGVPERRRLAAADGKPLADAATLDPRVSVAGVLVTHSVLMIAVLLAGAVLGAAGVLNSPAATKAELSAISFVGAGAVVQLVRVVVIYPLLRGVKKGHWHPSKGWHQILAYPRDTDFILQAVVVLVVLLLYHG